MSQFCLELNCDHKLHALPFWRGKGHRGNLDKKVGSWAQKYVKRMRMPNHEMIGEDVGSEIWVIQWSLARWEGSDGEEGIGRGRWKWQWASPSCPIVYLSFHCISLKENYAPLLLVSNKSPPFGLLFSRLSVRLPTCRTSNSSATIIHSFKILNVS